MNHHQAGSIQPFLEAIPDVIRPDREISKRLD